MSDDKVPHDPRMRLMLCRNGRAPVFALVWYDPLMCWESQTVAVASTKAAIEAAARLYGHPFVDITR